MLALMDPMPVTRFSSAPVVRPVVPATRTTVRVRRVSRKRSPVTLASSRFAACLKRCAAAGVHLVITAPVNAQAFAQGIKRFSERQVDVAAHEQWETAYRIFCGGSSLAHDQGSWRILAVDREDRVVGAVTGRFFCGEVPQEYLHVLSLLNTTGPVFREHCELAVSELVATSKRQGRTLVEISHWAVAPVWHAALIAVTLIRAMGALVAAFKAPIALMAADNRGSDVNRLMRLGSVPLGLAGRSCLPPFVHHESGAWLRLLVLDAAVFHARHGGSPAADLALLRGQATIISVE